MTADELAAIREHIGSDEPPSDADLDVLWERLGSVEAVALSVLRSRHAEMLARPAKLDVDDDHTEDWTKNLDVLSKKISSLGTVVASAGGGTVSVARLQRGGRRR